MPDTTFDTQPILDEAALNELKDMLDGGLNEIIESFLDSLDADLAAIEQAFDQGHLAVRAAAHSLKGSAGNLALRRLAAWASTLEKKALAGDLDACRGLMSVMLQLADASRQALRAYMAAS